MDLSVGKGNRKRMVGLKFDGAEEPQRRARQIALLESATQLNRYQRRTLAVLKRREKA